MSDAAYSPYPTDPDDVLEDAEAMDARHRAMAREMAAMGMDLARAVWRQGMAAAEAPADQGPTAGVAAVGEAGQAFARITRAVRLAMALEAKISAEAARRRAAAAAVPVDFPAQFAEALATARAKLARVAAGGERGERFSAVRATVERLVRAQVAETPRAMDMIDRVREDLFDAEAEDEAWDEDLSVDEVVARICWGLGIDPLGPIAAVRNNGDIHSDPGRGAPPPPLRGPPPPLRGGGLDPPPLREAPGRWRGAKGP